MLPGSYFDRSIDVISHPEEPAFSPAGRGISRAASELEPRGIARHFRIHVYSEYVSAHPRESPRGRLAQLVRAPALQAGGRRFESCTAHHSSSCFATGCGEVSLLAS